MRKQIINMEILCATLRLVAHSCPILYGPMDYSPPSSSVYGDSPGKNTGVGSYALLSGSSQPRDWTQVSHTAGRCFFVTIWATREAYHSVECLVYTRQSENIVSIDGSNKSSERTDDDDIVLIRSWILKKNEFILYFWLRLVMTLNFFLCSWSFPA